MFIIIIYNFFCGVPGVGVGCLLRALFLLGRLDNNRKKEKRLMDLLRRLIFDNR